MHDLAQSTISDQPAARVPLVSCICPTYNRPPGSQHLLEEAIASFLLQTYPHKELLVINDCPGQELVCDAPDVRIVNLPTRFSSLGEKYNAGIAMTAGELIANWDDDDISLPWRLSLSVERLAGADYFNPKTFWFMNGNALSGEPVRNVGHNLSLFRRSAFERAGGYPPFSLGVDQAMDAAFHDAAFQRWAPNAGQDGLPRDELFYIYRWGISPNHLSAVPDSEYWETIGTRPVQAGAFILRPHWRQDYALAARRLLFPSDSQEAVRGRYKRKKCRRKVAGKSPEPVVFVLSSPELPARYAAKDFPMLWQEPGESPARHLDRVMQTIDEAVIVGGSHLLIPPEATGWLNRHPLLAEYFADFHEMVEATPETGIVLDLRRIVLAGA